MLTELIGNALNNTDMCIDTFYEMSYEKSNHKSNTQINNAITNFNRLRNHLEALKLAIANKSLYVAFDGFTLGENITPDTILPTINFFQHPHNNLSPYNLVLEINTVDNKITEEIVLRGLSITKDQYKTHQKYLNKVVEQFDCRIESKNDRLFISSENHDLQMNPSVIKEMPLIIKNVFNASEVCGAYLMENNRMINHKTVKMNKEVPHSLISNTIYVINKSLS